jgi:hypothetical protein
VQNGAGQRCRRDCLPKTVSVRAVCGNAVCGNDGIRRSRADYAGPVTGLTDLDELRIPRGLRPLAEQIIGATDAVCLAALDEEYADLARRAVAKLARKRPSPLSAGRPATWAAGVVHALGQVNFLSDPASVPCATPDQLCAAFGVAKSTMGNKAKQVRDLLRIDYLSPEFQRADVAEQNPALWMIQVGGLIMDARDLAPEIQAEAWRLGLIPYIPALGPAGTAALAAPGSAAPVAPPAEP